MSNSDRKDLNLPQLMLRHCRATMRRWRVADSSGVKLTGAGLLTRSLLLRRLLRREVLADDERHVGVILPSTVAGVVVNAALALDRRVVINLNYTVSSDVINHCIASARIRHVLTSRKVMERFPDLEIKDAEVIYLEDIIAKLSLWDKVTSAATAWLTPLARLERKLGLDQIDPDDLLTIIFTSGSTGIPKGAMLTYRNVGANIFAFDKALRVTPDDVFMGILPFFHSYGYTTTLWTVLAMGVKGAYHFTPLEPRQVGKLCRENGGTILIGTPTFLRSYVRRCEREDFQSLDVVIAGAEKLPADLSGQFEEKFGVRPVEGYGTTELSPVVSVNVPPSRDLTDPPSGIREGTIGLPLEGLEAKVIDPDTGHDLPNPQQGILCIRGPSVMKGYLDQPELTAEVIRDGWYVTGDMATIDEDGFILITGRLSRFSKIGGEMVPHIRIEDAIVEMLEPDEDGDPQVAVSAVPDKKKGERLLVLYTNISMTPEAICGELARQGLPKLWIPSPDAFVCVDRIPILGTGKLDLQRLKEMAIESVGANAD